MRERVTAIVPAAGVGKRFGDGTNKPFEMLGDRPLLLWAVETLGSLEEITEIIPVVKEDHMEFVAELFERYNVRKVKRVAPGGRERQESVLHGLNLVEDSKSFVLVHDGVRPLIEPHIVLYALRELKNCDGVVVGVPAKDTIKEVTDGFVTRTLRRDVLWAVQTPQVFRYGTLRQAYEKAAVEGFSSTDDSALVERYGGRVKVVMGSYANIKITTPGDLSIAEQFLRMRVKKA
ncbi:MAG: 2-C-methyl-D-erythritol 4-phosphate cytidylyltransferase [Candidatus Sulfobium sp.]